MLDVTRAEIQARLESWGKDYDLDPKSLDWCQNGPVTRFQGITKDNIQNTRVRWFAYVKGQKLTLEKIMVKSVKDAGGYFMFMNEGDQEMAEAVREARFQS